MAQRKGNSEKRSDGITRGLGPKFSKRESGLIISLWKASERIFKGNAKSHKLITVGILCESAGSILEIGGAALGSAVFLISGLSAFMVGLWLYGAEVTSTSKKELATLPFISCETDCLKRLRKRRRRHQLNEDKELFIYLD
jgi:hypothetical protein